MQKQIASIPANIQDTGKVRIGGVSPSLGPVVRTPPAAIADSGKVRLGGVSPSL